MLTITLEIPALDRLLAYLESKDQAQIDALAAQVRTTITDPLHNSATALHSATTAA